jgi:putative ABC transport system permease protein
MRARDLLGLSLEALNAHRLRYRLSALAITVGVAAVVLMSSIGEGTRAFILSQMGMFGTNLIEITPGKVTTSGVGALGGSARKLTIDDARALARLPGVKGAVPFVMGGARVEYGSRARRVFVFGTNDEVPDVWTMRVRAGSYLPRLPWDRGSAVVVLGSKLKRELFGDASALGAVVRIGTARFRVIGVMESKGNYLSFDLDDLVLIPVANALALFNKSELEGVDLLAASLDEVDPVAERARRLVIERHRGVEDFTIVTQKDARRIANDIMNVVTGAVTAIAAISLLVGAIGIFTILWIVVQERVQEIGLVKALGGTRAQILAWFLCEAAITALAGGAAGLLVGAGGAALLVRFVPGLESSTPPGIVAAALAMALSVGLAAGVAPALRAARLDPVEALRSE